ncbi:MAG: YhbY family RNA-binding protein [Candidatus Eisenbacteria bacterium]|uniref:YhbY family RNA-binding protein n=1 Tax=Eiseniibacteriota bacterium TaxID=2212470 RepID=A0A956RRG2_UNCEI|nr:YhbY family RNA-binding protein [Candidatus Eisenbacteria bacterium]
MELTGKDRRYLRGLGNPLKPVVWIGREGITPGVLRSIDEAHLGAELIKVKMLDPGEHDRKAVAAELAEKSPSHFVGMVGGTILLFRRHPEKPRISLPSESDAD